MGIRSVAVYSDADRAALHVRKADEAAHLGPSPSRQSYLNIERILDAARRHGADAIHPGYGFLSENAEFAQACTDAGFVFIGPPASAIAAMGSKTSARRIARAGGAPIVPGTEEGREAASAFAQATGYPVMLKAVAGGGGKGMRRVDRAEDLAASFDGASSEALRAFGDGRVYVEKLIENARHIEIQLLGDQHGNMVHLGERECSLQRRHQKVVEECPSPLVAIKPEYGSGWARPPYWLRARLVISTLALSSSSRIMMGYCSLGEHAAAGGASGNGARHGSRFDFACSSISPAANPLRSRRIRSKYAARLWNAASMRKIRQIIFCHRRAA